MTISQIPILIFLIPFLSTVILPFSKRIHPSLPWAITSAALFASAAAGLAGMIHVQMHGPVFYRFGGWHAPYGIEWRLDALSGLFVCLTGILAFFALASTQRNAEKETAPSSTVFYMTSLLLISGLFGMILTNDLFNLFVFLEVSSLSAYALIASGDPKKGSLASFKYLILGTIGAQFYLIGVGYLYAETGTLNMSDVLARLPAAADSRAVFTGLLFIFLGLAVKMGLFPFHGWMPDAYTYASNTATCLIAPVMTKVSIYAMIRIIFWAAGFEIADRFGFFLLLKWFGAAGIVLGSVLAFTQTDVKRMLAYSSVCHIGLIAAGIGLKNPFALTGAVLHIVNHAVMKASLFLSASAMESAHGFRTLADLKNARGKMPWTFRFVVVAALSMIGIPPLAGFFSKWYLIAGALEAEDSFLAFLIAASSLLTALYFFRILEPVFYGKHTSQGLPSGEGSSGILVACGFFSAGLVLLGIYAPRIMSWGLNFLFPPGGGL